MLQGCTWRVTNDGDKLSARAAGGDTSRRSLGAVPGRAGARRCRAQREGRTKRLAAPKPRPGPAGRLLPVTLARPRLPGRPVLPAAPGPWTVSAVRGDGTGPGPASASPLPAVPGRGDAGPCPGGLGVTHPFPTERVQLTGLMGDPAPRVPLPTPPALRQGQLGQKLVPVSLCWSGG